MKTNIENIRKWVRENRDTTGMSEKEKNNDWNEGWDACLNSLMGHLELIEQGAD